MALRLTESYDTLLVNFYADWCRFSQLLAPIFEDAGSQAAVKFPTGSVALAKVDCETEAMLLSAVHVVNRSCIAFE
ncbi:unnamed protein product [Dibothriocephalus latus]|uniref:Thioredoxin domain-containing protein n=1 Tax=Dibothriocephalus latus TaxID=60516 RepID=A0A3P7MRU7_DIBLA|nr:unnamed protein product [Dibothriocephalus latus]